MRTLHLTIRKEQFKKILSGETTRYIKEIKPTTKIRYCEYDSHGELIGPRHCDALKLAFGQMPDKDWIEVEVIESVVEQDTVIYDLGKILQEKVRVKSLYSRTA